MTDTAVLSQEGQITMPETMQKEFKYPIGTRFVVYYDGQNILLKPSESKESRKFTEMMKHAQKLARESGLTENDITESIKTVRLKRKT